LVSKKGPERLHETTMGRSGGGKSTLQEKGSVGKEIEGGGGELFKEQVPVQGDKESI